MDWHLVQFLTLVFIPTLYAGLENALNWIKSLHWGLKAAQLVIFVSRDRSTFISEVEDFVWQMLDFMLIIVAVPGVTGICNDEFTSGQLNCN